MWNSQTFVADIYYGQFQPSDSDYIAQKYELLINPPLLTENNILIAPHFFDLNRK